MAREPTTPYFAPQLFIPNGTADISFYIKGLGAIELRKFMNDDGTYHVAELSLEGRIFHLHEANVKKNQPNPEMVNGTTVMIGLFVDDVDTVIKRAIEAGAELIHAAEDFDYGYRQGEFKDPFGHLWLIEKKI
ncbi:MAG: VOC family protein [Sphingobacteriales bacterium]|nr:MAG: VOC family protein [Sphingobacteriales bacterium]